jgi:hypothetical protein
MTHALEYIDEHQVIRNTTFICMTSVGGTIIHRGNTILVACSTRNKVCAILEAIKKGVARPLLNIRPVNKAEMR